MSKSNAADKARTIARRNAAKSWERENEIGRLRAEARRISTPAFARVLADIEADRLTNEAR